MGAATRWLEARRIRNRTPDFSSSNSSIDSFEVTRSIIFFISFRFIRINPRSITDERSALSLRKMRCGLFRVEKLPRRLFDLISGAADLLSSVEQQNEVMVRRDAPSNHHRLLGD